MNPRNWVEIRSVYVEGHMVDGVRSWPTLDGLAAMFNVPASSIRKVSMREHWPEHRNEFRTGAEQSRRAKALESLASVGLDFDRTVSVAATQLVDQVRQHVAAAVEANTPLPPNTVKTLAAALVAAQQAGRLAKGDATSISESSVTAVVTQTQAEQQAVLQRMTDEQLEDALRVVQVYEATSAMVAAEQARTTH